MIQPRPVGDIITRRGRDAFRASEPGYIIIPGVGTFCYLAGWWWQASIPLCVAWVVNLMPLSRSLIIASCFHDWTECLSMFSQRRRDEIYIQLARMDGCSRYQCAVMYRALRLAGPFRGHATAEDRAEAFRLGSFEPE